jgi:3-carboxy-cis,cis-muconate cycloisomerase
MAGRTWLQQATPITFGLKAAGWLDALERSARRLRSRADEALVLQFGGASGTLAALGTDGPAVAEALAARLGLGVPAMPWHGHRDRLAAVACAMGLVCGTAGKIARDVALLGQTEVGEAFEAPAEGRGGSSTMPHKRNPVHASVALAAAARAPGLVATMLTAMPQEHERGLGGWQAEWETLPELIRLTAGAARATADALDGLAVDPVRMRGNLDLSHGLAMSESIAMALAPLVGKSQAHTLIERASRQAHVERRPLAEVLAEDPGVTRLIGRDEIARRLVPENYLGAARLFVDRVLAAHQRRRDTNG